MSSQTNNKQDIKDIMNLKEAQYMCFPKAVTYNDRPKIKRGKGLLSLRRLSSFSACHYTLQF